MTCPHEFWEREASVATENYCPICMAADLQKLRQELVEVNTTLQLYSIEIDRQARKAKVTEIDLHRGRRMLAALLDKIDRMPNAPYSGGEPFIVKTVRDYLNGLKP